MNTLVPTMPVAIIGMGCRFPGAADPDAFWRLLASGGDAITEVPPDRWDIDAFYDPDMATPGTMSTRWGGFLDGVDQFDARFFGVSHGEARTMDPQQRLLLEVAWEAVERASITPASLAGSTTGVFVGIGNNDYGRNCLDRPENINAYFASGNALCMSVNRLSHFFDLKGPSLAVDSGCSSSLVALHYACQSLRLGECSLALAGGVNLVLSPQGTIGLSQSWLTAADGRCKSFDEAADGYVRSDGCGVVVLKRLQDAIVDRDPILAVVRGSAVNQDGRSVTFTTPSGAAQVGVMRAALDQAGITPDQVSYVEAHGVGTSVMDAVEAQSIATVYGDVHSTDAPCIVGSVKTNIGHLEWASGIAGLIKIVLSLQHNTIPAHLHLRTPIAPLRHQGLRISSQPQPWPTLRLPRRTALSSFGLGGTNVHAIIEEAPAVDTRPGTTRRTHLLVLSAQEPQALAQLIDLYAQMLEHTAVSLEDICCTAATGRAHFPHRIAVIADSLTGMAERLRHLTVGSPDAPETRREETTTWEQTLRDVAGRYLSGAEIDWEAVYPRASCTRVSLPTYPFQRRHYWLEGGDHRRPDAAAASPDAAPDSPWQRELAALPEQLRWDTLLARVQAEIVGVLGLETPGAIDLSQGFFDVGMRSLAAMELRSRLQAAVGASTVIPATTIFDHPTTVELTRWLAGQLGVAVPAAPSAVRTPAGPHVRASDATREPIAITGIGLRFPGGVSSPQELWTLLQNGVDAVVDVPENRWDRDAFYSDDPDAPGRMYTRRGGFVADIDAFDAQFFGIIPREAESLDPQQRLLLEVCWEALEHAGHAPSTLAGSRTGVFVALGASGYADLVSNAQGGILHVDPFAGTGNGASFAAGRISYVLGTHGPCVAIDTACSSSLVAVHLACQSLRAGESTLALAGGVNLILRPEGSVLLSRMRALSPDGRCKAFDELADGYGRGEGCGVVVLQRLSDALANAAPILAVIRGSAVNHDGRSGGLTVPSGTAQRALLRDALANAGVDSGHVGYVEAHGTGTPLGDPIEVAAIAEVFGTGRASDAPLRLGSIKANIAHLESAAGVAGLIKAALVLGHEEIPPQIHFDRWNPELPHHAVPLEIPTARVPWPRTATPRIAGVSAFGMSGTNAHVILEEAPPPSLPRAGEKRPFDLLCLSAKNAPALHDAAERWAGHLEAHPEEPLGDVCHTSRTGRTHFAHRLAVVAASQAHTVRALRSCVTGVNSRDLVRGQSARTARPRVAFLFSGQGAQYPGMGRELFEAEPVFRAAIEECDTLLCPHLPHQLLSAIYPPPGTLALVDDTLYTQPAMFAIGYALSQLWRSWGVEPVAVIGHSLGEYTAACVAGTLSLAEALGLVAVRARLMNGLPQAGEMAAVLADPAIVTARLSGLEAKVSLAAINGPLSSVISGDRDAIRTLIDTFESDGIDTRPLRTSHAFHSPLMEPILDALEQAARTVTFGSPRIPLVSNLTGQYHADAPDAAYFRRHAREPVQFAAGITALAADGVDCFIEMGPHRTLSDLGARCLPATETAWLPSLERGAHDCQVLLTSVAALYTHGAAIDWEAFDRGRDRRRLTLPAYPFRRSRHWVTPPRDSTKRDAGTDALPALLSNLFVDVVE